MRHTTLRPGVYYGWLIVATTFWMAMFTGSGRSGFGAFVIPMSEELGWNRGTISLAAALGALISGLSQPFVGRLSLQRHLSALLKFSPVKWRLCSCPGIGEVLF